MKKLINLSDGRWIDPCEIVAVFPLDSVSETSSGIYCPARVIVHTGKISLVVNCEDFAKAQALANELAGLANKGA